MNYSLLDFFFAYFHDIVNDMINILFFFYHRESKGLCLLITMSQTYQLGNQCPRGLLIATQKTVLINSQKFANILNTQQGQI